MYVLGAKMYLLCLWFFYLVIRNLIIQLPQLSLLPSFNPLRHPLVNPEKQTFQVYCDIFDDGKVDASSEVYQKIEAIDSRQHAVIKKGVMIITKIEGGTSPLYEAEFTHVDVVQVSPSIAS
ncbi:hypothetical protein L1987_60225 [Smallanthus sonchifolius]|uniref:Uncharacterized protein n=1 Tax=Smallanthus sonchifolius TaxID=185202 RepID=A0ACB9D7P6_9ASTR|nr:hypothetical protein L1987_60225 [Smallanthus sonchifolius]